MHYGFVDDGLKKWYHFIRWCKKKKKKKTVTKKKQLMQTYAN